MESEVQGMKPEVEGMTPYSRSREWNRSWMEWNHGSGGERTLTRSKLIRSSVRSDGTVEIASHSLGRIMDDLSYFREDRVWAAGEDENQERRKPGPSLLIVKC